MMMLSLMDEKAIQQLPEAIRKGIRFLEKEDVDALQEGNYELEGKSLFVEIQEKETKFFEETFLESHKKYIDVHVVLKGREAIGYKSMNEPLQIRERYNVDKDLVIYENPEDESTLILNPKELAIFYPTDAHRPGGLVHKKEYLKKAVIKIQP